MPSRSKPPLDRSLEGHLSNSKKTLQKTDYKPDFDEYVRCRRHEHSVERLAKMAIDVSKQELEN